MKKYFKGFLTGFIVATIISATITSLADNIEVILNSIRLNINGTDMAQWGEDYTLENGNSVPYSIMYKDTTYLPMRKIGEMYNKDIHWNGDSNTVYMSEPKLSNTSPLVLAERPDVYGNVWTYYYCCSEEERYLCVKDNNRSYERLYKIAGGEHSNGNNFVYMTEDSIIFTKYINENEGAYLWKIDFLNDINNQDGEKLEGYLDIEGGMDKTIFFDDYMLCVGRDRVIYALNLATKEVASYDFGAELTHTFDINWPSEFYVNKLVNNKIEFPVSLTYRHIGGTSATMQTKVFELHHDEKLYFIAK